MAELDDRITPKDLPPSMPDALEPTDIAADNIYVLYVANEMKKKLKRSGAYKPIKYIKSGPKFCIRVEVEGGSIDVRGKYQFKKVSDVKSKPSSDPMEL